ncbi:Proliferation-associated protein A [Tetrabaena socialis]|uniref:Proliferation-associated protein A n=1 Tax=Tetrabaena socialis TaxID=47790 RepID=A0A2J7ZX77_9CHLO|nr:Proliferation-associated protein A [Tetrabaena socialis]|eukprot:PNH04869.1 Proliferation-associated protein A [Tetrabaena socialis]
MSDDGSAHEAQEPNLSVPEVVTKYKAAADIVNRALQTVIDGCKDGAKVLDLCRAGDTFINKECGNIYKGKAIEKGVAFPTCVSSNSVVGHYSPNTDDATTLKAGDIVKMDAAQTPGTEWQALALGGWRQRGIAPAGMGRGVGV